MWSKYLVGLGLILATASNAKAQTVVTPTAIEFDDSDYSAIDGGQQVVTSYVIELWTPGSDTTQGTPQGPVTQPIPKAQATQVAGQAATRRTILVSSWGIAIPQGPTWVATVKTIGPGGTARSAASNPFTQPIPVRAPKAVTNVQVK